MLDTSVVTFNPKAAIILVSSVLKVISSWFAMILSVESHPRLSKALLVRPLFEVLWRKTNVPGPHTIVEIENFARSCQQECRRPS